MTHEETSAQLKQHAVALLLLCARTQVDEKVVGRIRSSIDEGIDWEHFLELARQHWLTILCHRSLQSIEAAGVPPAVMKNLRASVQQLTWHGLLLLGELCKLMALYKLHGIQVIPFKGPALSALAYGDPVLRFSGDLDLLVSEQEIPRARQILVSQGYVSESTTVLLGAPETAVHKVYHHELFTHPETEVVVELHWKVDECAFIRPFDPIFCPEGFSSLTLGGTEMPMLPPGCLLLLLCAHGAKHRWWQLRWICDIAEYLRRQPELDCPAILALARRTGNERVLRLGLLLAHDLLGCAAPAEIVQRARADRVVVSLAHEVRTTLGLPCEPTAMRLDNLLFHIRAKEHLADRLKLFMHFTLMPAEADWTAVSLPTALSFLYFILRPLRLIQRYGAVCVKQLFRQPS